MSLTLVRRLPAVLAVASLLAACAGDSIIAPTAARPSNTPALAVTGGPNLGDARSMEGQLWVCKDGAPQGVVFAFNYSIARQSDGVVVSTGTTNVPVGGCVLATSIATNVGGRYRAIVTEQTPPPDWSLTGITWAYPTNYTGAGLTSAIVNLPTRTISNLLMSNDLGVQVTFTNAYNPTAALGDRVWYDVNGDGVQDAGETGIAGVTMELRDNGGNLLATTTTAADGIYGFANLPAGSYKVCVVSSTLPSGYYATYDLDGIATLHCATASLASGQVRTDVDFGYTANVGQLGDFVWDDLNNNGVQDAGEPGIAGRTVTLSGDANASTTTDANGGYLFTGLAAGNYIVTVATPSGYVATSSNQGGDPAKDSNGSPAAVTLPANNSIDLTIDFGFVKLQGPACTLTQGYWKTHGEDWDSVADGKPFLTTTTFYNSGKTYLQIMLTPPAKGNAYLQLAHQFIAASLNTNGGASGIASVDAALAGAAAYFASAPAGIPSPSGAQRTQLLLWAETLDNYNNGRLGTPHCD